MDDPVWDHSTSSFNRERLFDTGIAQRFFEHTVLLARLQDLVSDEHFPVDGTSLEAWASHRSFRPKDGDDGSDGGDFRGPSRSNDTHASTTDPDARLVRKGKGKEAKLSCRVHALMENRNGLLVGIDVRHAAGTGETRWCAGVGRCPPEPRRDLGRRQRLRHARLRRRAHAPQHPSAHRTPHERPAQRDRRT